MDIQRKFKAEIRTRKNKKIIKTVKFKYIHKKTKRVINDPKVLNRINSLRIPPAYVNVTISNSSRSKIQAIGVDDKGRKQYIYNPKYLERQTNIKFKELILFGKYIKKIRRDVNHNIKETSKGNISLLSKESLISMVLFLVDKCHFRIGCEKYKLLYKTYGVTTLNKNHFKIADHNVEVEFIGKKGVLNKSKFKNKDICKLLTELCKKNNGDYLFYSGDKANKVRITEKHVNNFLKKYNPNITVKMFRTWKANYILLREILQYPIPETKKVSESNIRKIIKSAALKLHHTNNVSKKSYLNNKIIDLYVNDTLQFKKIVGSFKKKNGSLPTIDRILSLLLVYFDNQK